MSASYTVEERNGKTVDVLTDGTGKFRLMVARVGAEPVSLAVQDKYGVWEGFLWRDGDLSKPEKGWGNHATVMGYYVARILGEKSHYRGQEIRGGTHSFLRHKTFQPPAAQLEGKEISLTYTMTPAEYGPGEYPLKVKMLLTYTLVGHGVLRVGFRFENEEPEQTAHVSFGLHPGFGTLPGGVCNNLDMPQGTYRRLLAPGNFLSGETVAIDHPGGTMMYIESEKLPDSYIFDLAGVPERRFTLSVSDRRVVLDFAQVPYLTMWSDGSAFLCVEPCWGLPDHANQRPFEDKAGMMPIAPGGVLERSFAIYADITVSHDDYCYGTGRLY